MPLNLTMSQALTINDLKAIDFSVATTLQALLDCRRTGRVGPANKEDGAKVTEDNFAFYFPDLFFTIPNSTVRASVLHRQHLCQGEPVELVPGGAAIAVTLANCEEFANLALVGYLLFVAAVCAAHVFVVGAFALLTSTHPSVCV